jgi:uncharacterized protein (DUF1800 family)
MGKGSWRLTIDTSFRMRIFLLIILLFSSSGFRFFEIHKEQKAYRFPFKEAGLTKEQAAAHLLNRFTYGATLGLVKEVTTSGLEKWFAAQLLADDPDVELLQYLAPFDALQMSNAEIVANFPKPGQLRLMGIRDSVIRRDTDVDKKEHQALIRKYMQEHGFAPKKALIGQVTSQKIMRAVYSKKSIKRSYDVFLVNHFNVSFDKKNCIQFILSYERDVIRPNALGKFGDLLLATAKSPAMLTYLDNFNSIAASTTPAKGHMKANAGKKRLV